MRYNRSGKRIISGKGYILMNMSDYRFKHFSWDFLSKVIIISYLTLQAARWPILPQFMDIYYHLQTAWGFIQAGGYSGWDFWQYAPVGRIHIYPPFFHIILAGLLKLGISAVILAKAFEVFTPVVFLFVLWRFVKRNFDVRLAFFVLLFCSSSFAFFVSLINHVPATLSLIFCFLALDRLFQKDLLRSVLLLLLSFYTHIGISWFFILAILIWAVIEKSRRKRYFTAIVFTLIFCLPLIIKQLAGVKFITSIGLTLNERYILQFKLIDYIFALLGLIFIMRYYKKYRFFLCLFLASFIYLSYPYRFFCAEGYLPIVFLCAVAFDAFYEKYSGKRLFVPLLIGAVVLVLFFSPTLSPHEPVPGRVPQYRLKFFDSAFLGMLFARGESTWFPEQYFSAARIIKDNSRDGDIIFSNLDNIGLTLASISARPTANALLPEIKSAVVFDPISSSRLVVFTRDDDYSRYQNVVDRYRLVKIGENKIFMIYENPACFVKMKVRKASVPFWAIAYLIAIFIFLCLSKLFLPCMLCFWRRKKPCK